MKKLTVNKLATACSTAMLTTGVLLIASPAIAFDMVAAGTQIKNLATVTYQDTNGNTYTAQSNEAVITVKQVYAGEISVDTEKTAAAGQMVYSQHTITNAGNGTETYTLAFANETSVGGANLLANGVKLYSDTNGNGLADAGEPEITSVTLEAGKSAAVVMAIPVPNTAVVNDKIIVKLTATGDASGVVDDTTASDGLDAAQGTNHATVTVTNGAVLNYTKSAVLDPATNQITYTLLVSNTGNATATDVKIYDALPDQTTFVSATVNGLLASNNDVVPTGTTSLSESTVGLDLNKDADQADTIDGIYAMDKALAAGATVSVSFVVKYDPLTFNNNAIAGSAGDVIKNTAFVSFDQNGDGTPDIIPTNSTQITLPQSFGVKSDDTGSDTAVTGQDDDTTNNDTQYVDSAPPGSTVLFNVVITNNGTGTDTFELSVANTDFPVGTVFTFWNADGTVQLVDTNGKGTVDTGMLAALSSTTIMVKAQLPAGVSGTDMTAVVTATSAGNSTVKDNTSLELKAVSKPSVDLFDDAAKAGTTTDEDSLGDSSNINMGTPAGTRSAIDGIVGGKVNIPFYIDNDSGASDSFQLSVGSTWDGTTLGSLPTGWTVLFYEGDGAGNPIGSPLTSTKLLPAGAQAKEYVAVVTIASDAANALADYPASSGGFDANNDGDGDQPIFVRVNSANTGAADIMLDAVDIKDVRALELTPPGSNQIQPGGSVSYIHSLVNTGNTDEVVELTAGDSLTSDGWNNNVLVDTNGDGTPDKPLSQLVPGDVIVAKNPDGSLVNVVVSDADGDKNPEITLPAGAKLELAPTVFAPTNAAPGNTDTLTITAQPVTISGTTVTDDTSSDSPKVTLQDVTTVQLGQVRLTKTVAYDAACDGTADGAFEASLTAQVAPAECAIWKIVAENQGDADAVNVVIRDNVPAFTTYQAGSLMLGNGVTPVATVTDATADDAGEINASTVTFYAGTGADSATSTGGKLIPGEKSTVQFSVKVNGEKPTY